MCVIVYKPDDYIESEKDRIILLDTLDKCAYSNPDLCGYMYQENSFVIIRKGFESLQDMLNTIPDDILENNNVVFHFRIATHGKVIPDNAHPFPITNELELLTSNHVFTEMAIAHNGVLYGSPTKDYYKGKYSDTLLFTKMVLSSLDKTGLDYILKRESNSNKFCIMSGDEIKFYGSFQDYKGLLVSNTNFVYKKPVESTTPKLLTDSKIGISQVCIYCGQELYPFEKSSGICSDCLEYKYKNYKYDPTDDSDYEMVTCNICDNTLTSSKWDIEYSEKAYGFFMCAHCEKIIKTSTIGDDNENKNNQKTS